MVCPYNLSRPGGVQGQVLGLSRALLARGHRVTVVAPDDERPVGPQVLHDGDGPDLDLWVIGHTTSLRSNGSVAPVALSPSASLRANRILDPTRFDVVHWHEPMAPGISYRSLLAARVPMVATFHRAGGSSWYKAFKPLAWWGAGRIQRRVAVSEAARLTAEAALGGHYEVLFNGVELGRFSGIEPTPTDRPTILFLGRHEERKGLGVLLEAFEAVPDPVRLWIAGDGPSTESLRRRHPASARLEWLGLLDQAEVAPRLAGADILCAPSLRGESFGMVLLEAMAAGTVVVASDLDGYRAASGGHAVLVPPGDGAVLGKALVDAVADVRAATGPASGAALAAARRHADAWSMDLLAVRYLALYEQAIVEFERTGRNRATR